MSVSAVPRYDVIVLGGGAAGLMCAAVAGQRGRRVLLLEHNDRVGKKIQISGGGRCNFTNLGAKAEHYLSRQPDFCKSALARYSPMEFVGLVESYRIAYHEKKLGQQFCDENSGKIIDLLLRENQEGGVKIYTSCRIESLRWQEGFGLKTSQGEFESDSLVVATGGLSFPKLGASDLGYRLARQFGLEVTETRPGLVPLTFVPEQRERWVPLSGVSLPVRISNRGKTFEENLLVTHRGFSGPAILQISSYWREGDVLEVDLLPGINAEPWLRELSQKSGTLEQALGKYWPQRFAEAWCAEQKIHRPLAQLSAEQLNTLAKQLKAWPLRCAGTEGYAKAEVTLGGVATAELSSKTMEARKRPGLYFIGEVVDVTGWLGGYNFQWAWASAQAAGRVV